MSTNEVFPRPCSIASALGFLGEKWSFLVVRELALGVHRFDQIARNTGAPRDILTSRLRRLEAEGVLEKRQYQDRPARYEYRLTPKGVDLSPALVALMRWGDKHLAGDDVPTVLVHDACGHPLDQTFICWTCDTTVQPTQIKSKPGRQRAS